MQSMPSSWVKRTASSESLAWPEGQTWMERPYASYIVFKIVMMVSFRFQSLSFRFPVLR